MAETDIDKVIDGLYISGISVAKCDKILTSYDIKNILTVMKKPLPDDVRKNRICLNVDVIDHFKCEIFQYFQMCLNFISQALHERRNVLVHW